jgi:ornithine cyclodeaminase
VAVWNTTSAELEGVVLGERLGKLRTGAIGGVAVKYLSSPTARSIAVIGSGSQARTQLEAAAEVRSLTNVRVYSPDRSRREAFAAEMEQTLKLSVTPCSSAESAVQGAEIVIAATTSKTPVIRAEWLDAGAHVSTMGGPKTIHGGPDVADRAELIVTDSPEQTHHYPASYFLEGTRHMARMVDLADVISGRVPVQQAGRGITLFCSVGLTGTEVLVAQALIAHHRTIAALEVPGERTATST